MTTAFPIIVTLSVVLLAGCRVRDPTALDEGTRGIKVSWQVGEYRMGKEPFFAYTSEPIEGVTVCVLDAGTPDACEETDEGGVFTLTGVPKYSEVLISLKKGGFASRLVPIKTGYDEIDLTGEGNRRTNPYRNLLAPMVRTNRFLEAGCPRAEEDDGTGSVVAVALKHKHERGVRDLTPAGIVSSVPRTRVRIEPKRARPAAPDLSVKYYSSGEQGTCSPDAAVLTKDGAVIDDGFVTFFNLQPGRYVVKFEPPSRHFCEVAGIAEDVVVWGFRTTGAHQTEVPVRNGFSTITILRCFEVSALEIDGGVPDGCDACTTDG